MRNEINIKREFEHLNFLAYTLLTTFVHKITANPCTSNNRLKNMGKQIPIKNYWETKQGKWFFFCV